ncbi:MAG: glycosyltransferase [Thermoguttaceae bacterium]|jgi:glycosyltransferase involved in cell wall biosynthesis
MRILWIHNFAPEVVSSGVFMQILFDQLRALGADVTLHYMGNLRSVFGLPRAIRTVRALSRDFDLVHAQYGSACGVAASFARVARLITLRGSDLMGQEVGNPLMRAHGLMSQFFTRFAVRRCGHVVVVSRRMREMVLGFCPAVQVHVLPSGIDLAEFRPMDRMAARQQLGCGGDASPWVLFSSLHGDSKAVKRFPLARAAFARLQTSLPGAQIKFLTGVPHERVPLWVNAANVVLLTSTHEGWPNIIKEGLACNVPFVSTDVGDLAAIAAVEPNCFVTAPEPDALAECLRLALEHQGPANLRRHVEPMELASTARQLLGIYEQVYGLAGR